MNANELRVGCWYNWRGGDAPDEGYDEQFEISDFGALKQQPAQFRPIRITSEWLLKLGFSKGVEFDHSYSYERLIQVSAYPDGAVYVFIRSESLDHIEYVHQLQNLYLALTGKEFNQKQIKSKEY